MSEYPRLDGDGASSALVLSTPGDGVASAASEWVLPHPFPGVALPRERSQAPATLRRLDEAACRLLNILVALVGLVLTAPLMVIIAFVIARSSPGPVVYSQLRIGLDRRRGDRRRSRPERTEGAVADASGRRRKDLGGHVFRIYKFRTMVHMPEKELEVWCAREDPRITPMGRFLRKTRMDELPQLWNVLLGDMNVVGPRPEQLRIFGELREQIPGYERRQVVRPGITGWAQINQAYDTSLDDVRHKLQLDLEYIGRRSSVEDLTIMARTLPVMVLRKGSL